MKILRTQIAALLLCLLTSTFALAQVPSKFVLPEQAIEGTEATVSPGEIIILSISSVKTHPKYLEGVTYEWKVFEDGKEKKGGAIEWPDKTKLVFGSGNLKRDASGRQIDKQFNAMVAIAYLYLVREGDKEDGKILEVAQRLQYLSKAITVTSNEPQPPTPNPNPPNPNPNPNPNPPGPAPNPNPAPIFPPGRYGLSKLAYDWSQTKVNAADRKAGPALAKAFNSIAAQTSAGTLTDITTILKKTKADTDTAILSSGSTLLAWDAWGNTFQDYIYDLYMTQRTMRTPADIADAWRETAAGLERVQ